MSNSSTLTLANLLDRFKKALRQDNPIANLLANLEAKTKVNREYLAYGIIGFLALYLIIGWGNDFICNLIGFVYPAYCSIKAIESVHKEDDTKWLMYWTVYALFGILEVFSDQLLFWIPLYTLTKCVFLLWLMVPGKNGGTFFVYNRIIKPFFLKHQSKIDEAVGQAKKVISENLNNKDQ